MEKLSWHELTLQDQQLFDRYFQTSKQRHGYTFANFYTWREHKSHLYAEYKDHLIVADTSVSKNWQVYEPLGKSPESIIQEGLPIKDDYNWVRICSETIHKLLFRESISLDRNNQEYVHVVDELASLTGKKYDAKRNFIRRFHHSYPCEVVPITAANIQDCYALIKAWSEQKGMKDCADCIPISDAIANYHELSFDGICVYIEDKMVGFAIGEEAYPGMFVERYEKGYIEFTGIYPVLLNELAKYLQGRYQFINREQDLGIPGLRKAKLSWHPSSYVVRYQLPGSPDEEVVFEDDQVTIYESKVLNHESIKTLYQACAWSVVDREPQKLEHSLEHSDTVLSAWKGKQLVGIANALSDGQLCVFFPHLIVHPDYQKMGIGKSMMEIMLKKYAHCDQKVLISEKNATKFYKKIGFTDTDPHVGMWIHNSPDL